MDTLGITQRVYFKVKNATSIAIASENVISKNVNFVSEKQITVKLGYNKHLGTY